MFIKNSILTLSLFLWLFPFSFPSRKKQVEIEIPKIEFKENVSFKSIERISLDCSLEELNISDKIKVIMENEIYFYKVIDKYYVKEKDNVPTPRLKDSILFIGDSNEKGLHIVISTMHIGKTSKN